MERAITLKLLLYVIVLVLYPKAESQWMHHPPKAESQWMHHPPLPPIPLCASQFALANHACAMLPYTPVPPPSPPAPPTPSPDPPSPPSPDEPSGRHHHNRGHSHGHGHSHRHHRHVHGETQAEGDCCRWVQEVDAVCVCDLLVHLPLFLTKTVHNYTVVVDDTCSITFQCGSRLVRA